MNTAISSNWEIDKMRWQSFYQRSLARQINRLISLINKKKKTPAELLKHFESMLTLFEQGRSHPDSATRLKLIHFVHTLHPLPLWWGKWSEWMHVLEQASFIAQEEGKTDYLIWLYLMQAEMMLSTGRGKNALSLSQKALKIARKDINTEMILRAEMSVFEANKYLGLIGDRIEAMSTLENSLKEKSFLLSPKVRKKLEVEVLLKKTDILRRQGHIKEVNRIIQQAYLIAKELFDKDDLFMATVYTHRSAVYWSSRKYDLAIANHKKALAIFTLWGDQISQIDCEGDIGLTYWSAGKYKEAEQVLLSSVKKAERLKLLRWQAIQMGNLGLVHFNRGRLTKATVLMQRHRDLSALTDNYAEEKRALGNLGTVQIHLGLFQEALENMQKDHKHVKEMQLNTATARLYAKISWALDGLGEKEKAIEHAQKSLHAAEKLNEPLSKIIALRCLSALEIPLKDKIRYAEKARALAQKHNRKVNEAGALFTLADAYENDNLYYEAVEILKEIGAEDWLKVPLVFETIRLPLLL